MIGKTRQIQVAEVEEVFDPEVGQARGVLRRPLRAGKLSHSRRQPAADLAFWIAHYWMISWDLRGCEPHIAENLPHPNIHLVFEADRAVVLGVQTQKFSRVLDGRGRVFGVKFRPGGFRSFLDTPMAKLRNRTIPADRFFGSEAQELATAVLSASLERDRVEAANAFFRPRMPQPDQTIELAAELVDRIFSDDEIKTVDDLASRSGMGKRSLQRLFNEYVGVSPKWVIRRYRLHELLEKFNSGAKLDWPQLALELGYFDQAHLINDFSAIIGYTPTQYQKLVGKKG